jgi:NAD-dependent deacetylase
MIPAALRRIMRRAKNVVVITGAGVSAESGVPTFRDAQTGLWASYDPAELATPEAFQRNPRLVWEWYAWRRELIADCQPNPAHFALARLEQHVPNFTLITQNVDGFHHLAGSKHILELHGNLGRTKCFLHEHLVLRWDDGEIPPTCPHCGSLCRPDVVWFGENLPYDKLMAAWEAVEHADVTLSIGTSSVVYPAAQLPLATLQAGGIVVEINPTATPLTQFADFVFVEKAGSIVPQLVAEIVAAAAG